MKVGVQRPLRLCLLWTSKTETNPSLCVPFLRRFQTRIYTEVYKGILDFVVGSPHIIAMGMAINREMPEDVLMLILSRLPVQSLLRFRSVSKYWYSLIQNPSFISLHNNRSQKNDSLLVSRYPKNDSNSTPSPVSNETSILDLDVRFGSPRVGDLHLLGSSNGLVCLADPSAEIIIVLCNPAMKEFRVLPRFPFNGASCTNLGFAFDPKTNDYIVLRVAPRYEYDSMICFYTLVDEKVQMYHMSTDSWREIIATVPKDMIWHAGLSLSRSTLFNGVLYWVGCDPCGGYTVVAFHMFDKLFEQVFLPEDICVNSRSSISVLRDSLAFVSSSEFNWLGKYSCFDIWVRDGNGVEDLWNKKYSIGPILGIYDPLACRQNGELLLLRDNDFQMVSYNLDTHQVKTYQEGYDKFHVLSYTENLVSVKRRFY